MYDFKDFIGNIHIVDALKAAIKTGTPSHAYIISGESGLGKKYIANTFAKGLLCESENAPCGVCVSCRTFESLNNPDVFYIRPENKTVSGSIGIDEIREKVIKNIEIKQFKYKYKIFIIEKADKMTEKAQNAFLKTLEDPPEYAVFLLLCENINTLLPTVVSRCVIMKLLPLPFGDILSYLTDRQNISPETARLCAAYSGGSLGKAINAAGSESFMLMRSEIIDFLFDIKNMSSSALLLKAKEFEKYKLQKDFFDIIYMFYRDMLVLKTTNNDERLSSPDIMDKLKAFLSFASEKQLLLCLEAVFDAKKLVKNNSDFLLTTEVLLIKLKESLK
ncbi:MAG: DNA polymerase III subunit delta' [Lachnospiraceae bacterium]|nr:DNA polymerase III subunit delta' [Lachnospiraceae bacterium]